MAKGFVPIKDLTGLGLKKLNDYLSYLYLATKNVAEKDIQTGVGNKIDITQNPALNHTGDVTSAGGGVTTITAKAVTSAGGGVMTITAKAVTMAKIQDIATAVMLGRVTSETGITEQLTVAQVRTLLTDLANRFVTDAQIAEWTAKQAALGFTPENIANKNQVSGYAGLGVDGKIDSTQLSSIAINDTFVVATQEAMLALVAQVGDVCVRTDLSKSFILTINDATVLANWQELLTPISLVQSVSGKTGTVILIKGDVGLANVDNTSDIDKPVSTAQQTALDGKVDDAQVLTNVPVGALFTDTVYTLPATLPAAMIVNSHFVYSQILASQEWIVDHTLGKYPSVSVVDSSGNLVIGDIHYISDTQLILTFNSEFSGKAYLN